METSLNALQYLGDGLLYCLQPSILLFLVPAIVVGLLVGLVPGLNGMTALAILIPILFVIHVDGVLAFIIIVALSFVTQNSGGITSILFNIPGTDTNVATLLDGPPIAQKGRPGFAIGGALCGSLYGAMIGCVMTIVLIIVIRPFIMTFTSSEFFALILAGLIMISLMIDKKDIMKGLVAAVLGLILSFTGYDPLASMPRFTFGSTYLYDGFTIIIIVIGLFALPEFWNSLVMERKGIKPKIATYGDNYWKDMKDGFKVTSKKPMLVARSSIIGGIIGVIPGIGASLSTFVAYGTAKQASKDPESFGKGNIEGVIAPECANNATQGGALLPLFAFGLPGTAIGGLMLSALLMYGLTPGTKLMTTHLNVVYIMIACGMLANVFATLILIPVSKSVTKLANIRTSRLFPPLVVIVIFATYAMRNNIYDIFVAILFGFIGIAMYKYKYPRAVLLIAYILGGMMETNLFLAINTRGPLFFIQRIPTLVILLIVLMSFVLPAIYKRVQKNKPSIIPESVIDSDTTDGDM
jgi:putative tricarboxylic transport membrane protein